MVNLSKILLLSHPQALLKICRWFFFSQGGNMLVPYRYSKLQDIVCRGASLRPATTQCSSAVWRDDGGGNGLMSWDWNDKNLRIMYFNLQNTMCNILYHDYCSMVWDFEIFQTDDGNRMASMWLYHIKGHIYDLWGVGAKQALQPYGNHCDRSTRWCAVVGQHSLKILKWKLWTFRNVQRCAKIFGVRWFILTFPPKFEGHSFSLFHTPFQIWLVLISFKFQWTTKNLEILTPIFPEVGHRQRSDSHGGTWGRW